MNRTRVKNAAVWSFVQAYVFHSLFQFLRQVRLNSPGRICQKAEETLEWTFMLSETGSAIGRGRGKCR